MFTKGKSEFKKKNVLQKANLIPAVDARNKTVMSVLKARTDNGHCVPLKEFTSPSNAALSSDLVISPLLVAIFCIPGLIC